MDTGGAAMRNYVHRSREKRIVPARIRRGGKIVPARIRRGKKIVPARPRRVEAESTGRLPSPAELALAKLAGGLYGAPEGSEK
jgi:hypothetical protein